MLNNADNREVLKSAMWKSAKEVAPFAGMIAAPIFTGWMASLAIERFGVAGGVLTVAGLFIMFGYIATVIYNYIRIKAGMEV